MGIEQRRIIGLELEVCIVVAADAEIYARGAPFKGVGSLARVLQRLPGNLEQQALLWIHTVRFTAGDAEENRIELIDLPEEASLPRHRLSGYLRVGCVARRCTM